MSPSCAYEQPLNYAERIAYICVSAFSGSLSIVGSFLIIYIILRGGRTKLSRLRNRLLLGMSIIDIFYSAALGLSVLPIPQETVCSIGMGNLSTCTVQGFFIQLGTAVPGYNTMLSIYFLMTVRYSVSETTLTRKYEPFMHAFALFPPLVTAIIGAVKKMYFNETTPCWIGDKCRSLGNCPVGNVFGRGLWIVMVTAGLQVVNITITVTCMLFIYFNLRKTYTAMQRHAHTFQPVIQTQEPYNRTSQIEFAATESIKQSFHYSIAFVLTYMWTGFAILTSFFFGGQLKLPKWFLFSAAIFQPLQGWFNFWAYIRPIISATRRENNDYSTSFLSLAKMVVIGTRGDPSERRRFRRRGVADLRHSVIDDDLTVDSADHITDSITLEKYSDIEIPIIETLTNSFSE